MKEVCAVGSGGGWAADSCEAPRVVGCTMIRRRLDQHVCWPVVWICADEDPWEGRDIREGLRGT